MRLNRSTARVLACLFVAALSGGTFKSQSRWAVAAPPTPGPCAFSEQEQPGSGRFALLVGCTEYYHNPQRNLQGPANDVILMQNLLTQKFDFDAHAICVLSEAGGPDNTPTYAHIEREFQRLARTVRRGDQVVVLLSGHGSQQPDNEGGQGADAELDGLDETFLPADIGAWNKEKQAVENAIVDDQLCMWAKAITDRGALLWIVVDACHSGTVLRGDIDEVARWIDPQELGIPDDALAAARALSSSPRTVQPRVKREPLLLGELGDAPDMVALYACQPEETAPERPPYGSDETKPYGLLTYTLCSVLSEARSALTYHELAVRINERYISWGRRTGPTPSVEGKCRNQLVLGSAVRPPALTLQINTGQELRVNGGQLHGLTTGTVLAVYRPPGADAADKVVGYVKIKNAEVLESVVEPCAYDQIAAPLAKSLEAGSRCQPALVDFGTMRIKVAVDRRVLKQGVLQDAVSEQQEQLAKLEAELQQIGTQSGAVFELVGRLTDAEWAVQMRDGEMAMMPVEVACAQAPATTDARTFVLPGGQVVPQFATNMQRIAQAQNLVKLASAHLGESARDMAAAATIVSIKLEMLKLRDKDDPVGAVVETLGGANFADGDRVTWRICNNGRSRVYVTLLYIDGSFAIEPLIPGRHWPGSNRLDPGASFQLLPYPKISAAETAELEHVVAIAVLDQGLPADFSVLEQPAVGEAFSAVRGVSDASAFESPLGKLLKRACNRSEEGLRGTLQFAPVEQYQMQIVSWRVAPLGHDRPPK
jgi:hypothetical protein